MPGCVSSKSAQWCVFGFELREEVLGFKLVVDKVICVTLDVEMRAVRGLKEVVGVK